MVHEVRACSPDVMVHIADFTRELLGNGITDPGEEPVVVNPVAGEPVARVQNNKDLILNDENLKPGAEERGTANFINCR